MVDFIDLYLDKINDISEEYVKEVLGPVFSGV